MKVQILGLILVLAADAASVPIANYMEMKMCDDPVTLEMKGTPYFQNRTSCPFKVEKKEFPGNVMITKVTCSDPEVGICEQIYFDLSVTGNMYEIPFGCVSVKKLPTLKQAKEEDEL